MSKLGKSIKSEADSLGMQLRQVTSGRLQEEKSIAQGIIFNAADARVEIDEAYIRKAFEVGRIYRELAEERGAALYQQAVAEAREAAAQAADARKKDER